MGMLDSMKAIRFSNFRLDPTDRQLQRDGLPVDLGSRAFDLLLVLVQNAGRLVDKAELMDRVWPRMVVEEANLHVQITAIRKAIGRDAIATVPGRGYQFVLALQPGDIAPAGPSPAASNLAAAGPPLLGRDADLSRVAQMLANPSHAGFITLTGAGGSGKTLLARHLVARFGVVDGQAPTWVDLLELTTPESVLPAVAAAAGLQTAPRSPDELARTLAGMRGLLVLDNAEHVLDAVGKLVEALRRGAPGLTLLVTSQAPLRRDGEVVHQLGGLSVPVTPCTAAQALQHAAVALFVAHARLADRRFRFGDEHVDDVVAICASLAGLALGVQLAASLLGQMSLAAVRARLARRDTGPEAAAVDASANVLRSALSWSHDLLTPDAQRVFRRLGIAQGPLPLSLVRALAAEGHDAAEAADAVDSALGSLVERSLVQCETPPGSPAGAPPRYRLLEAPRALALEHLQAAGERSLALERLAQALAPLGDDWYVSTWRGDNPARDSALVARRPVDADITAVFEAALQAPGLEAACVLARLASLALTLAKRVPAATRVRWAKALDARTGEPGLPAPLRGRALVTVTAFIRQSDLAARQDALARCVAAWHEAGDVPAECRAVAAQSESAANAGRVAEAEALLARARALEDPAWPPGRRRWLAYSEGIVAGALSDLPRATAAWRRHLALVQQLPERGFELMRALYALGHDELAGGDVETALPRLAEALAIARQIRDHEATVCYLLPTLVMARTSLGQVDAAREAAAEGWPHALAHDADAWWADHLALLAVREGRPHTAARLLGLADAGYARINDGRQQLEKWSEAATASALCAAIGAAALEALRAEGRDPAAHEHVFSLALAREDSGPAGTRG